MADQLWLRLLHHKPNHTEPTQEPTGGEARWEVEELLQELADAELEKHVMVTTGVAAMKNNRDVLKTHLNTLKHA